MSHKKLWECKDSNPGLPGARRERNPLYYAAPPRKKGLFKIRVLVLFWLKNYFDDKSVEIFCRHEGHLRDGGLDQLLPDLESNLGTRFAQLGRQVAHGHVGAFGHGR